MAAGLGFKTFTTGEVLTAGDVNGYLMQGINVFTNATARDAAITAPAEGQFAFTKDNNSLWYYDGAAWVASGATGDIEGVTAGVGISGGGTSGTVTVTNSMATTITTKGDLVPGTGSGTFARLAAGANDTVLTADSSTATGLKWATPSAGSTNVAGKNGVLNSQFNVWQRGTSISLPASTQAYVTDRWQTSSGVNQACTISRQATGDTTNLPNIQYALRYQRNSGQTGTGGQSMYQSMETINSVPFSGKTVTVSVYARAGANYSAASSVLQFNLVNGTGTDQSIYSGLTGQNTVASNNMTLTTTWQRFTYTATVPTNSTQLAIGFGFQFSGTAGTNDYFEVTGVQLEIASSATAYSPNTSTYQAELAACQRYFQLLGGDVSNEYFGIGAALSTTDSNCVIPTKVTMRVTPTTTFTTASNYRVLAGVTSNNCTNTQGDVLTKNTLAIQFNVASGLTLGQATRMLSNNTSATISISAEL